MQKFSRASKHGKSDEKMQLCQRAALYVPPICEDFNPQMGEELLGLRDRIHDLVRFANLDIKEELIVQIEGLIALVLNIQGCNDYVSVSAAIFLYARKFLSKSITTTLMEYVSQILEFEPQSGKESICTAPDWIDMMRGARGNWDAIRSNKFFSNFSKLLGLLVTAQLCSASQLTFSIKEYKIWEPNMKVIHGSAIDIFDAALSTVTYFVETISLCWKRRSLKPLIFGDEGAMDLDERYSKVILWWDLVKNGNLQKVANVDDHEFDRELESVASEFKYLLSSAKSFEKKLLQDKFMRLLSIKNDYITLKISSGVRKSPFVIELYGASSQGKTTCGEQIVQALLTSAGLSTDKRNQASYNAADKFMSNWTTDKTVLIIDDMANDKSSFVERPPTRVIIDVCNNQPFYANMADLGSKGKVFVEPHICLVTTNVKDLDARIYSNHPYSIQRRMHVVITVKAKPQFQYVIGGDAQGLDPEAVMKHNREHPDAIFDDIWDLTLERAQCPSDPCASADYAPIIWNGRKMEDVSFVDALAYLIEAFHLHRDCQSNITDRMMNRNKIEICGVGDCKHIKGACPHHTFSKQFGLEISDSLSQASTMVKDRICNDLFGFDRAIEGACTAAILSSARMFTKHWDWMQIVPTPWVQHPLFLKGMMGCSYPKLRTTYMRMTACVWGGLLVPYGYGMLRCSSWRNRRGVCLGVGLTAIGLVVQKSLVNVVQDRFRNKLVDRNTVSPMVKQWRDEHVENICKAGAIVGALYGIAKVYRAWKRLRPQGSLEPKCQQDVDERDSEVNIWTSVTRRKLPTVPETANTTSEQLRGLISKNLVYGTVHYKDANFMVNGLFITSNVVLIPGHYFKTPVLDITFRKRNPETSGGKFAARVSLSQSYKIPDSDLIMCYCATGGSFKNLTKYFPIETFPLNTTYEYTVDYRRKNGNLLCGKGLAKIEYTTNGIAEFAGLVYQSLTFNDPAYTGTFNGMCGAVLVSPLKPLILGFHLGGKDKEPRGCAGPLYKSDIEAGFRHLRSLEGVIISGSAEKFEPQVLGVNVLREGKDLHFKSPLNWMPHNSQVEYYGECPGMVTFKSNVKKTLISDAVAEVMDSPNIYHGPVEEPQYYGWQECLSNLAVPALPYDPDLLISAVIDYKREVVPLYKKKMWDDLRPLTDKENIGGIPGKKFLDAIPMSTSIGYPLSGPKRDYLVETLDPDDRTFIPEIMEAIESAHDCYKQGRRAYTIAKACKKDEILSKDKCRIFYGNSIATTFLVRKYFLPLIRPLQFHPKVSECAVGINCHGPEWDELYKHIIHFGEDRLIGGDYGKYDQKLPSQLILAALRILIDCAKECEGYTEQDIRIMEAMTGDIVYAIIAYNGDLIGLTEGTHISGNSLTVIINGICGSLNMRCYFKSLHPDLDFRKYVKLITYGDDNIGSVHPDVNDFTIKGASAFLASYGQVYTMPDKESELRDFLPFEEFEFLKRKSVWIPELNYFLGALIDKSCKKMLHCYLREKNPVLTEEHACAINIDTALREWFNHGRCVYEERREQLREIASRTGITYLCTQLDVSYDEAVERWKEKYDKNYISQETVAEMAVYDLL